MQFLFMERVRALHRHADDLLPLCSQIADPRLREQCLRLAGRLTKDADAVLRIANRSEQALERLSAAVRQLAR